MKDVKTYRRINILQNDWVLKESWYQEESVFFDNENVLIPEHYICTNEYIYKRIENFLEVFDEKKDNDTTNKLLKIKETLKDLQDADE